MPQLLADLQRGLRAPAGKALPQAPRSLDGGSLHMQARPDEADMLQGGRIPPRSRRASSHAPARPWPSPTRPSPRPATPAPLDMAFQSHATMPWAASMRSSRARKSPTASSVSSGRSKFGECPHPSRIRVPSGA